jgi:hypothetical protein
MVAIPTQVVEVGEGTLRVELMMGEVVRTESLAVTCWIHGIEKYREKKKR